MHVCVCVWCLLTSVLSKVSSISMLLLNNQKKHIDSTKTYRRKSTLHEDIFIFWIFSLKKDISVYEIISNMRTLSNTRHSWIYLTSVFWAHHINARHSLRFWDSELSNTVTVPHELTVGNPWTTDGDCYSGGMDKILWRQQTWTLWILQGTQYDDSPQRRYNLRSVLKDWIGINQLRWWVVH